MQVLVFHAEQRLLRALWCYTGGADEQPVRPSRLSCNTLAPPLQHLVLKSCARAGKRGRHWFTARLATADCAREWLVCFGAVHLAGSYAALVAGGGMQPGRLTGPKLAEIIFNQRASPA